MVSKFHNFFGKVTRPFKCESLMYTKFLPELSRYNPDHIADIFPTCYMAYNNCQGDGPDGSRFCEKFCWTPFYFMSRKVEKAVLILEDITNRNGEKYQ